MSEPRAIVIVPARDEQDHVVACVSALARQGSRHGTRPWVVVVDDGSRDATHVLAERALRESGLVHDVLEGPGAGVGWARRAGMDRAARWALRAGATGCLLVSTDADTVADPGWLDALLDSAEAGGQVIAGDVLLAGPEPVPAEVSRRRARAARDRLAAARDAEGADVAHHHFACGNLALTLDAYEAVGGMPVSRALEDEALLAAARAAGVGVMRTREAVVRTSPRAAGRVSRGLAVDIAVETWRARRRHHHREFPVERLVALAPSTTVSVIVPAREVAGTIGNVLERTAMPLLRAGVLDEVLVVDADSRDGTARIAAAAGARVVQESELRADLGPCRGKGDAMWRALHVATGDVVAFLDADTADPQVGHLAGILGPLLLDEKVQMVRGAFDRPRVDDDGRLDAHGGGRVTELAARPLINVHFPLLAGFRQPLAGEFAGRRELLRSLPFPTGYGVETATLIDALAAVGLSAIAECDLGRRQNRHQPLRELSRMAFAVLCAAERRVGRGTVIPSGIRLPWHDDLPCEVAVDERPPVGIDPRASHVTDEAEIDRRPRTASVP